MVFTIAKQCNKSNINFQILCFDDGSDEKWKEKNKELAHKIHVNYTEMPENLGRSKIRNWLGNSAYFEYLLFLDGDSTIPGKNFIRNYLEQLPTDSVLYGGTSYKKSPPTAKRKYLHWLYGRKAESLPASKRRKYPYRHFHTNNFIVPASVFKDFRFNEDIKGYGYEDLLYAANLQNHKVEIKHIDNPVIHDGLEYNHAFIEKTKQAIKNLTFLYRNQMLTDTSLTHAYEKLVRYKLSDTFEKIFEKWMLHKVNGNLMSEKPNLRYFQLWKLYTFIQEVKDHSPS
jgi:FMN phosphatase YigB (HAD superfamily)